jgi:hypothetical protein
MIRRPLDLLVASQRPGQAGYKLALMGASVAQVHYDRAVATMKYALRVADAVVVDTTNGNVLTNSQLIRGINLATEIHRLPNYVSMPNGTRWNGIPIALLVDGDDIAAAVASDPALRFVVACVTQPRWNWYYDYVDPWQDIYERIDKAAYENTLQRLEEMQSLGHRFQIKDNRWIRLIPPSMRRRLGALPEIESLLYDGRFDKFLRRHRQESDRWTGRDVVLLERSAVERDLYQYEYLVSKAHTEAEMQRFYEQSPYVLGAGAYETSAHPAFQADDASSPMYPDLVQHPFNTGLVPKAAKIIELKTPRTRLLTKTGLDWHWARQATAGLAQTRRYAAHAKGRQYKRQMEAIFGEAPKRIERLLIAGNAGKYDRERLALSRSYDSDVEVRGHDEMFGVALERYAS